jgi:hypothetical protein
MRWITAICLAAMLLLAAGAADADVIPLEGVVPNAAAAYLTSDGLAFIGDVASTILGTIDVADILYAMNPLINITSCDVIFKGSANITDVSIGQIAVSLSTSPVNGLTPVANGLYVDIQISPAAGQNLMTMSVDGYWGLNCTTKFDATGTINATPLELAASITVSYSEQEKGFNVVVQQVVLNSSDITVNFAGLPDPSLGPMLQDMVLGLLPSVLEEMGPQLINQAIAGLLANLSLSGTSQIDGYTLVYAFDPTITTDPGGVNVAVDGQLYVQGTTVDPCIDPGPEVGSPYTAGAPPAFGLTTPSGEPYDVGFAIADNLLNQMLYSFIAKGAFCMMFPFSFREGRANLGGHDAESCAQNSAALIPPEVRDANNLIDLYPVDLPHFVIGQGAATMALISNPYRLDWYIQEQGRWVNMLTAEIDLDLAMSMTITSNNELQITLENSSVQFDVTGSVYNVLPTSVIQTLLNTLINNDLLPMLSKALPTIPLPTLAGYQFVVDEIGAMGASNNYFGLYCDLAPTGSARETKAAVAPATTFRFRNAVVAAH